MGITLSATERAAYQRDGVIRLRRFFDSGFATEIRREVENYIRDVLRHQEPPDCTFEADGTTVRNLWRLQQYSDFFRGLGDRDDIRGIVRELVRGEPCLMAVETFNKPAEIGSAVPYHQDNAYFCQVPPDVLTIWIAIDPVTVENGAVYYVKGSHHSGNLPTKPSGTPGNSTGLAEPPDTPESEQFCCTMNPGDLAIHHCQTIHHSKPNSTAQSRLGLLLVYRAAHTKTDAALKLAYESAQR